jgi:CheY-like chemotaxis protein
MILNSAGFKATAFDHPEKAARESAPQLLITDVVMPGMTGVELAIQFRANYPDCHMGFTGSTSTRDFIHLFFGVHSQPSFSLLVRDHTAAVGQIAHLRESRRTKCELMSAMVTWSAAKVCDEGHTSV